MTMPTTELRFALKNILIAVVFFSLALGSLAIMMQPSDFGIIPLLLAVLAIIPLVGSGIGALFQRVRWGAYLLAIELALASLLLVYVGLTFVGD